MAMPADSGFEEIKRRFGELWQQLLRNDEVLRPAEERRLLIDRVRNALDRGESRLLDTPVDFIANTFAIEHQLSIGQTTEIYSARHRDLGSRHVLKILKRDHIDDPIAQGLLLQEAALGLRLRHQHIITTQTLLRTNDGRPAIVFEWCEENLAGRLHANVISADGLRTVMTGILEGLSVIHEHGIIHGDISPDNILFADRSLTSLRIADFGIALPNGESRQKLYIRFAGKPDFAAPEQKEGRTADHRADLFSAGRLLSWMLQNHDGTDVADLHVLASHLSQPSPQDRPKTAKAALLMLGGFLNQKI